MVADVIAEPVRGWFEHREGFNVGLFLRGVRATRYEGNDDVVPGALGGPLNSGAPAQHNEVSERDHLRIALRAIELLLDSHQRRQHRCEFTWIVDRPTVLRGEAKARA